MKTIVQNSTNLSKYLVEDSVTIESTTDSITVGSPAQFIISDLNDNNSTVYANITDAPADWSGNKYFFDGTDWTLNPDWVDPMTRLNLQEETPVV